MINIRNPWGSFEWQGDWSDKDRKNWTDDMVAHIKPEFGDDGTFWMCFKDFMDHFRAINICKVSDWEEVRVKGEFTNFSNEADAGNHVRTRYHYELSVPENEGKQRVFIGVHNEDERI